MPTRKLTDLFPNLPSEDEGQGQGQEVNLDPHELDRFGGAEAAKQAAREADVKPDPKPERKRPSTKKPGGKRVGRPPMSVGRAADLQRKELALTPKQADQLLILSRQLNRARNKNAEGAEPITESALMRCALEVLFAVKSKLGGDNEEELLASALEALGL